MVSREGGQQISGLGCVREGLRQGLGWVELVHPWLSRENNRHTCARFQTYERGVLRLLLSEEEQQQHIVPFHTYTLSIHFCQVLTHFGQVLTHFST